MNLLKELQIPVQKPPTILCDNIGGTYLCQNPVFHSRMKHIVVDFHFVRDQVQRKQVVVTHVHGSAQLAYTFTKALSKQAFHQHLQKLGVVNTT